MPISASVLRAQLPFICPVVGLPISSGGVPSMLSP